MAYLLSLIVNGVTRLQNDTHGTNIYADKHIKNNSNDNYILLGGGGHIDKGTFALANHGVHWEGFTKRATSSATWGTLISASGYTPLFWLDSTTGGGVAFSDKGGQTFMQIDGYFYQNEGRYRLTDVTETVTALGTSGNYLTWTRNGTTSNITVPYATKASQDGNGNTISSYYVTLTTEQTITGIKNFNTTSNSKPVCISRTGGSTTEVVKIGVNDSTTYFNYVNDEASCSFIFSMENTDSESGGGAGANTSSVIFNGSSSGAIIKANGFYKHDGTSVSYEGHTHDNRYYTETEADNRFVNVAGDTMTGVLTMNTGTGIQMKYTSKGNDPWIYANGAPNYGIRYFEGDPDKMTLSASGNNNNTSTADLCINGNGEGTVTIRGNTIWHAGNDGSGSGLDADKVDGYHASSLWRSDGGVWNPSANISLGASANSQEWSFDITRNGYTGCYWHVWDSQLSTMLRVNADDGKVSAPYGFVGNLTGNASSASTVTVNNSDANSTYRMVWHSGNTLYSTAGIYCNPNVDSIYASFMELSRTADHGLKVGSIRGTAVGSRTGQYIHMYERVHIGSPNGWGSNDAPAQGLSTYGGAWLAVNNGNVGIGTTNPLHKLHIASDVIYVTGTRLTTSGGAPVGMTYTSGKRGTQVYANGIGFGDTYTTGNDFGWIRQIETTANTSILEMAIGDDGDGSEKMYFRAYNTSDQVVWESYFDSGNFVQTAKNQWLTPARLQIGRPGTTTYTDRSCIGTTDGNLHLDSYKNKGLYLNYYSSSGNIWFNGESYYINGGYYNGRSLYANYFVGCVNSVTVAGDANTYYPVMISTTYSKDFPNIITIWKNLGSTTASYPGNHSNGTSSMLYRYDVRNIVWDGNGGYCATLQARYMYARLVSNATMLNYGVGNFCIWLRGGGTEYKISTSWAISSSDINVYYSSTNVGSSTYPVTIAPRTDIGNGGVYNTITIPCEVSYASSAGNADTVDGQHFTYSNSSNSPTYLWATDSNGSSFLAARGSISVNYANSAGTCSYPAGFTSRGTNDWSGVAGTLATDWSVNGADLMFKYDGSKLNVITDGRFYQGIDIYGASKRVLDEYDISNTTWGTATYATTVAVNDSNSNSTYRMVWHSGTTLYSTNNIYCNPSTDAMYATRYYATGSAGPHFTGTSTAGNWAYLRLNNSSVLWDIATNSSSTSVGANALDIREKGADYAGIAIRYNTSSYGRLVVMNNTNTETSIGYLNTKFSSSVPIWTVGAGIGNSTSFGWWYYNVGCKMYLTTDGYVYAAAYYESSDQRLKNFHNSIDANLDKLKSIPKKYFSWKKDNENKLHIGTSAQAIRELYPELVSESEDGMLSVDYAKLSIVALKAIDVLHDEIKLLKSTNLRLEKRIQELEK